MKLSTLSSVASSLLATPQTVTVNPTDVSATGTAQPTSVADGCVIIQSVHGGIGLPTMKPAIIHITVTEGYVTIQVSPEPTGDDKTETQGRRQLVVPNIPDWVTSLYSSPSIAPANSTA